jgi:acetylornithine aminotransferase
LVRFPPKQLIQTLVNKVKQQHGLIVVNEVTTGLGRTGTWYGFHHYDLQPDIVALGKGLGNGYPVSAVAMSHSIANRLENNAFHYVQSHQNDPLGCAIAKEVITVMREEGLVERSNRVGAYFLQELKCLGERHDMVKEVRGRGLMIALDFESDYEHFLITSVYPALLARGFLVGYSSMANHLRFDPALTIGIEDIARLVENLDQILETSR